jgi:hypothetical protein
MSIGPAPRGRGARTLEGAREATEAVLARLDFLLDR